MTLHEFEETSPELPAETLEQFQREGEMVEFADADVLFEQGQENYPCYVVLEGRVRITKQFNEERRVMGVHGRGHFIGDLSMVTGEPAPATAEAVGRVVVVRVEVERFREVSAQCTELAQNVLTTMASRARDVESETRQQEKLSALGKLAAGLAHELNNPAAAAQRSARQLQGVVATILNEAILHDRRFDPRQAAALVEWQRRIGCLAQARLSPLEQSDREEEFARWLEDAGVPNAWDLAPDLAAAGARVEEVRPLAGDFPGEALTAALHYLSAGCQARELAADVETSTSRIAELVRAMKEYSYMDQVPFGRIDVHKGIEATLRLFAPRLREGVELVRDYAADLPTICAYGNELNQVWTNLLDNALDAMDDKGTLTIRTRPDHDGVIVEIVDTGRGIPEEIQERIFEPFFTTKSVGEGTGLGLDISYRIVTKRHGGTIRLTSKPGETRFQVRLPVEPPKQDEP
ncbi:MAG: ATP-binding protein [Bryobacteraceae bacterium]|nr:ATP-binding protein [Bryobacteraceae bacterium]